MCHLFISLSGLILHDALSLPSPLWRVTVADTLHSFWLRLHLHASGCCLDLLAIACISLSGDDDLLLPSALPFHDADLLLEHHQYRMLLQGTSCVCHIATSLGQLAHNFIVHLLGFPSDLLVFFVSNFDTYRPCSSVFFWSVSYFIWSQMLRQKAKLPW